MRHSILVAMLGLAVSCPGVVAAAAENTTIELTRIKSEAPLAHAWLDRSSSPLCLHRETIEWTQRDAAFLESGALLKPIFQDAVKAANLSLGGQSEDLFGEHAENTELQVGALIRDLQVKDCDVGSGQPVLIKGNSSIDIEWQIYSASQGKTVARIPTHGVFTLKLSSTDPELKLVRGAMDSSVQALLQSPDFTALLTGASARPPSAALPPAGGLKLALSAPGARRSLSSAQTAVVSIFTSTAMGSGFLITPDGYILTNHHVAGDLGHVKVKWSDGSESVATVVGADTRRDVSLLKTAVPAGVKPLAIRRSPVVLGEDVYAVGTPREKEFAGTVTRGVISATNRRFDGETYIQSDVAITHGNSGGPLLDANGDIVGISQSVYEPDGVSQNINFFVPIGEALDALAVKAVSIPANERKAICRQVTVSRRSSLRSDRS